MKLSKNILLVTSFFLTALPAAQATIHLGTRVLDRDYARGTVRELHATTALVEFDLNKGSATRLLKLRPMTKLFGSIVCLKTLCVGRRIQDATTGRQGVVDEIFENGSIYARFDGQKQGEPSESIRPAELQVLPAQAVSLFDCKMAVTTPASKQLGLTLDVQSNSAFKGVKNSDGSISIQLGGVVYGTQKGEDSRYRIESVPQAGVDAQFYELTESGETKLFITVGTERVPNGTAVIGRLHFQNESGATKAFVGHAVCKE
jgi:hypothetical protein